MIFHTASLIDVTGAIDYNELYGVNVKGKGFFVKLLYIFSLHLFMSLILNLNLKV